MPSADSRRIRDDPAPKSSLGSKTIERMQIGTNSTMVSNDIDDSLQRLRKRCLTMEQCKCLAVVNSDSDFQSRFTGRFVIDDSTHFESDNFSADDPVLDHHIGSTVENHRTELQMRRSGLDFRGVMLRISPCERTVSDLPHPDVDREVLRSPRQDSCGLAREHVQCLRVGFLHPRKTHPEGSFVPIFDENPCVPADEDCRTDPDVDWLGDLRWVRRIRSTILTRRQMVANEGPQLETE